MSDTNTTSLDSAGRRMDALTKARAYVERLKSGEISPRHHEKVIPLLESHLKETDPDLLESLQRLRSTRQEHEKLADQVLVELEKRSTLLKGHHESIYRSIFYLERAVESLKVLARSRVLDHVVKFREAMQYVDLRHLRELGHPAYEEGIQVVDGLSDIQWDALEKTFNLLIGQFQDKHLRRAVRRNFFLEKFDKNWRCYFQDPFDEEDDFDEEEEDDEDDWEDEEDEDDDEEEEGDKEDVPF